MQNSKVFLFTRTFANRQIRMRRFQIRQQLLKFQPKKYQNKAFLVPKLGTFILTQKFTVRRI